MPVCHTNDPYVTSLAHQELKIEPATRAVYQNEKGGRIMTLLRFALVVSIVLAIGLVIAPETAISATPQIAETADQVVGLRNVTAKEDEVAGEVVNNSQQTLRDVQLRILYSWRWSNEFHPGTDDPGRAVYLTIDREIPPGQSTRFSYNPRPRFWRGKMGTSRSPSKSWV
jgi:hypothetical protein